MKQLLIILGFLLMLTNASATWALTMDDLVQRNGIYYQKFSDTPYTGSVSGAGNKSANHIGEFKKGKREGEWLVFYDNGQLGIKAHYKNGKHHGEYISYYSDGTLWVKQEMRNGKEHGLSVFYHMNGKLDWKGHNENGVRVGPWISYYENGNLAFKGSYKNGKQEGFWEVYSSDGVLKTESSGLFKDGEKIGE